MTDGTKSKASKTMLKCTLRAVGGTPDDLTTAVRETARLLAEQFTTGRNDSKTSAFVFDVAEGASLQDVDAPSITGEGAQELRERLDGLISAAHAGIPIDPVDLERCRALVVGVGDSDA